MTERQPKATRRVGLRELTNRAPRGERVTCEERPHLVVGADVLVDHRAGAIEAVLRRQALAPGPGVRASVELPVAVLSVALAARKAEPVRRALGLALHLVEVAAVADCPVVHAGDGVGEGDV